MRKIKKILALVMLTSSLAAISAEGADIVVLMDTSGTILPYFEVINNKILIDITKKFIREGDTFHLVSFNSRVNLEIAQPIHSEADLSRIVSRFMLLYPLGQNSDFLSGLQYIWQYVSSLDQERQKIIIVISDGIFNPPASSPYASYDSGQIQDNIQQISRKIHGAGWNVYYIKLPFPESAEIHTLDGNLLVAVSQAGGDSSASNPSGGTTAAKGDTKRYIDVSTEFTSDLNIETSSLPATDVPLTFVDKVFSMPEIQFPEDLGKKGRFFVMPLKVKNNADTPINIELTGVLINDGVNVLSKTSFLNLNPESSGTLRTEINLPNTILKGPQDIRMTLRFSDNLRVIPQTGTVHLTVTGFSPGMLFRTGSSVILALLFILLAIILVILFFVFIIRRTERPASDAIIGASNAATLTVKADQHQAQAHSRTQMQDGKSVPSSGVAAVSARDHSIPAPKPASPAIDSALPRDIADNSAILSAATMKSEKSSILSSFSKQAKDEPQSFNPLYSAKEDNTQDIKSISNQLTTDKNERIAVLSTAGKKQPIIQSGIKGASSADHIAVNAKSNIMLELRVQRQNTNIGKRNVHMMKAGSRLSIGGGQSPFLIFLVKFPPHIAEIRYDGISCDLAILKPEFFPYETENIIHDCINRNFTVISEKCFEITFDLQNYEDPVVSLNRLLTSIRY